MGFSTGLSPAPQAVPQAAAGAVFSFLLHPIRFESAMIFTSKLCIQSAVLLSVFIIVLIFQPLTSTHFFITRSLFCNRISG